MKITTFLIATSLLTACASQPTLTLDQKLAGKNAKERKEVLRLACLNEAEWPIYQSGEYQRVSTKMREQIKYRYNPEVSDMKSLCRKMDDLTSSNVKEKSSPKKLTSLCREKVTAEMKEGDTEHAKRIQHICEKMIGKKVLISANKKRS